jgi:hypothetical protein
METITHLTFTDGTPARITLVGESHVLEWTDGICVWEETYGSLSAALGRLALLAACHESGWADGFVDDEDGHTPRWERFVAEAVA